MTILVGKGDFFSAGADVKAAREGVRESEGGDDNARVRLYYPPFLGQWVHSGTDGFVLFLFFGCQ